MKNLKSIKSKANSKVLSQQTLKNVKGGFVIDEPWDS